MSKDISVHYKYAVEESLGYDKLFNFFYEWGDISKRGKWYELCPLRKFERQGKLSKKWENEYCKTENNWINCRRYQMEEKGELHPDNMLPSGNIDKNLR